MLCYCNIILINNNYNNNFYNNMKGSSSVWTFGKNNRFPVDTTKRQNIPGPGMYSSSGSTREKAPSWKVGTGPRSQSMTKGNNVPGVGQYTMRENSVRVSAPKYSMRPKTGIDESKQITNPGPGNYNPNYDTAYRSSERFTMCPKTAMVKDNKVVPGPGQYTVRNDKKDLTTPCYVFGKETKNKEGPETFKNNPGPGNYQVTNLEGNNSTAPKFSFGKDERGDGADSKQRAKTPGPGQYSIKNSVGGGPKISMSFVRPGTSIYKGETPGPGQYTSQSKNMIKAPEYR